MDTANIDQICKTLMYYCAERKAKQLKVEYAEWVVVARKKRWYEKFIIDRFKYNEKVQD